MESALLRWYYSGTYRCISSVAVFFFQGNILWLKMHQGRRRSKSLLSHQRTQMPLQCVSAILTAITAAQQPSSGGLDLRATSSITCGASAVALSSQLHRALKTGHCSLARHAFCFLREGHSVLYRLPSIIVATRRENTSALQHLINHDVT